jgi:hypothetical protein
MLAVTLVLVFFERGFFLDLGVRVCLASLSSGLDGEFASELSLGHCQP